MSEYLDEDSDSFKVMISIAESSGAKKKVLKLVAKLRKLLKAKKFTSTKIDKINSIVGELDDIFIVADMPLDT